MPTTSIYKTSAGRQAIQSAYDRLLAAWPLPVEQRILPTPLGDTFVLAAGDPSAPPLVLLHGSASNSAVWGADVLEYSRACRVYCVDIPGEPGKSAEARPPLNGPAYAAWLESVLNGLGIERCALLGISLGGWLALKFSTTHPARVSRLILLCPSGVAMQRQDFLPKVILLSLLGNWGANRLMRLLTAGQPLPAEVVAYVRQISAAFIPRMETVPLFSDDELRRLTMPVLLIAGEKDALLPSRQTAARLQSLLPCAETHVLPGVGHVLTNQTATVLAFLSI